MLSYEKKIFYKALYSQKISKIAYACWKVTLTTLKEKGYTAFVWNVVSYPIALICALYTSFSASPAELLQIKSMYLDNNNDDVIGFKLLTYYEGDW